MGKPESVNKALSWIIYGAVAASLAAPMLGIESRFAFGLGLGLLVFAFLALALGGAYFAKSGADSDDDDEAADHS
jgi:hypothetical protein